MKNRKIKPLILFIDLVAIIITIVIGLFSNINVIIVLLSILLAFNTIILDYLKHKNIISVKIMFTVFWFFYTNATIIGNIEDINFLFSTRGITYGLYYIAFMAFLIGVRVPVFKTTHKNKVRLDSQILLKIVILSSLVVLMIKAYYIVAIFGVQDFIFTSKAARVLMIKNTSILFSAVKEYLLLVPPLLYVFNKRFNSRIVVILCYGIAIYNTIFSLIIIDRSTLLFSVLPLLFLMIRDKKISKKTLLFGGIVSFFLLVDFKATMFNLINNREINLMRISIPEEFYVSYEICTDIVKKISIGSIDYKFGETYFQGILAIIFPFLDFEPLSIWYVKNYYPEIYAIGGGRAFSSVAEAYMNLGAIAVFIYYFVIGIIINVIDRYKENNDFALVIYSLMIPLTYKLLRSEFYSLTKTGFWFWIVPIIGFSFILNVLKRKTGEMEA